MFHKKRHQRRQARFNKYCDVYHKKENCSIVDTHITTAEKTCFNLMTSFSVDKVKDGSNFMIGKNNGIKEETVCEVNVRRKVISCIVDVGCIHIYNGV